jgi:hypothetical protein
VSAGVICAAIVGVMLFVGCAGAPAQKAQQAVAPDSSAAAKLDDVRAQVLSLAQSNQQIVQAIQKTAQDSDQFRTETKAGIASLSQVQFRIESWLAESVGGHWLLGLRVPAYRAGGQAGPELVDGPDRGVVHPVSDSRGAGAGAGAEVAVLKKKGGPTVLELLIAFVLGGVAVSCLMAFDPSLAAKVSTGEHGILAVIESAWNTVVGFVEGIFGIKRKAPQATAKQ